jgi:GTP-binding protein HflX
VAPRVPEFSAEESLDELKTLATSAGAEIAGEFLQRRGRPDPATLIGKGKLEEIAGAAASVNADLILFDHGDRLLRNSATSNGPSTGG